jgi:N-acetylmuramoyl-L-alanine amidase CwlA
LIASHAPNKAEFLKKLALANKKATTSADKKTSTSTKTLDTKPEKPSSTKEKSSGKKTLKVFKTKKQIRRNELLQSLKIIQLKAKLNMMKQRSKPVKAIAPLTRQVKVKSIQTQTYEVNKKFNMPDTPAKVEKPAQDMHQKQLNYYDKKSRQFTTTLVVPSSIVDNAQSLELKTYLVG